MNDDNPSRRSAIMIDREQLKAGQNAGCSVGTPFCRYLGGPFGPTRSRTAQNPARKPVNGEFRLKGAQEPDEGPNMKTAAPALDSGQQSGPFGGSSDEMARQNPETRLRSPQAEVAVQIDPRVLLASMFSCTAVLTALGVLSAYTIYIQEAYYFGLLARIFLLDAERNLPTLFSFALLVLCSLLLAIIATQETVSGPRRRFHWFLLAGLFFVMAFDEAARLHERLIPYLRETLNATGLFYFAWVIPAWIFAIGLSLAYVRFLLTLPSPFMRLLILSGAIYVGGALGVEMPGGAYAEEHGTRNFTYQIIASVEEALEMTGLSVFAYTLARLLGHQRKFIWVSFRPS
jgi:hypothetical protein